MDSCSFRSSLRASSQTLRSSDQLEYPKVDVRSCRAHSGGAPGPPIRRSIRPVRERLDNSPASANQQRNASRLQGRIQSSRGFNPHRSAALAHMTDLSAGGLRGRRDSRTLPQRQGASARRVGADSFHGSVEAGGACAGPLDRPPSDALLGLGSPCRRAARSSERSVSSGAGMLLEPWHAVGPGGSLSAEIALGGAAATSTRLRWSRRRFGRVDSRGGWARFRQDAGTHKRPLDEQRRLEAPWSGR